MVPDKIEVAREVWKLKNLEHVMLPKLSRMSFLAFQSSVYGLFISKYVRAFFAEGSIRRLTC